MKLWHPREKITQRRQELGLTPAMLAQRVGVSQTCVWNWEQGNTWPRPQNVVALARALDLEPSELMLKQGQGQSHVQVECVEPKGVDAILEDAKRQLAEALGLAKERVQLTFSVATS